MSKPAVNRSILGRDWFILALDTLSRRVSPPAFVRALAAHLTNLDRTVLTASLLAVALLPVLGIPYVNLGRYWLYVLASCSVYLLILGVLIRLERHSLRIFRWLETVNLTSFGLVFLATSFGGTWLILGGVPHISDEVAYQFQAKTFSTGEVFLTPPLLPEFFEFTHIVVDEFAWFGTMNPGWPAILALGYVAGVPSIVNPVLATATLFVLWHFYRKAGASVLEARIAVLLLGTSPFFYFLSSSYMPHTASLFCLAVFLYSWACVRGSGSALYAVVAGVAIGFGLLIRPVDAVVAVAPFGLNLVWRIRQDPRMVRPVCVIGAFSVIAVVGMGLYNQELTGNVFQMPMAKYFEDRELGRFGLGFGADMGTKLHGPEWPGYYPSDAIRVTSYRLTELLRDFGGFPLLLAGACFLVVMRPTQWSRGPDRLLLVSAAGIIVVYGLHFYHGIAFGPRHYFLAIPAVSLLIAKPLSAWIASENAPVSRLSKLALPALLIHTLVFAYPGLIDRYGTHYRWASAAVRDHTRDSGVENALVFVDEPNWGWKSAFPLNGYPLESNSVIFARDLGERNRLLIEQFPERTAYRLTLRYHPDTPELERVYEQ